jgi:hypothetical protein
MAMEREDIRDQRQVGEIAQQPATGRRPYVKPAFHWGPVFETTALTCGKTPAWGEHPKCPGSPHSS